MFLIELFADFVISIILSVIELFAYVIFIPIGTSIRWIYFKLTGKPRTMKELSGRWKLKQEKNDRKQENNGCLNAVIGLLVVIGIITAVLLLA